MVRGEYMAHAFNDDKSKVDIVFIEGETPYNIPSQGSDVVQIHREDYGIENFRDYAVICVMQEESSDHLVSAFREANDIVYPNAYISSGDLLTISVLNTRSISWKIGYRVVLMKVR